VSSDRHDNAVERQNRKSSAGRAEATAPLTLPDSLPLQSLGPSRQVIWGLRTSPDRSPADTWLALGAVGVEVEVANCRGTLYIPLVLTGDAMPDEKGDLLQGTLRLVVLKALLGGALHGYAIARWVEETTSEVLQVEEGSLYPALRRLEDRGFITAQWGLSENNRRARFYALTADGRRHLRSEAARWLEYSGAVTQVLRAAPSLA